MCRASLVSAEHSVLSSRLLLYKAPIIIAEKRKLLVSVLSFLFDPEYPFEVD